MLKELEFLVFFIEDGSGSVLSDATISMRATIRLKKYNLLNILGSNS